MMKSMRILSGILFLVFWGSEISLAEQSQEHDGWNEFSLREEIRPVFDLKENQDSSNGYSLISRTNGFKGLDGAWVKNFSVKGGKFYEFSVLRKTEGIETPRRSAIVKLQWLDEKGQLAVRSQMTARPDYPTDRKILDNGWQEISDQYDAPANAVSLRVELHLRWTETGSVEWKSVELKELPEIPPRKVKLATVHFRPQGGKNAEENRKQFVPSIEKAAKQGADLVCLPECLTMCSTGLKYVDVAEPVPGPSTEFFGKLAKKHDLYIVAGLLERSGNAVFNIAALIGPDGKLIGKYRKVCLPREEVEGGVTPGEEYPVFPTRFGKLGMMICWDVHFPEVARHLSNNGAEVIAMPIWGGNLKLARARAIENQVYLVTSTYSDPERKNGMRTGVFDQEGELLDEGREWGDVVVVEVDLAQKKRWNWLGDFKARIYRERPVE